MYCKSTTPCLDHIHILWTNCNIFHKSNIKRYTRYTATSGQETSSLRSEMMETFDTLLVGLIIRTVAIKKKWKVKTVSFTWLENKKVKVEKYATLPNLKGKEEANFPHCVKKRTMEEKIHVGSCTSWDQCLILLTLPFVQYLQGVNILFLGN